MKKFETALDIVIKQFGKDIITKKRFVSVLADYNAFYDTPAIRSVLLTCIQEGFFAEIHKIINKKSLFSSKEKMLTDAEQCIEKYQHIIKKKNGANKLTEDVMGLLAQKIVPDLTNKNTNSANSTKNTPSTKKIITKGCALIKEDYSLEILLLSVIALIPGNLIYMTYVELHWNMLGTFLLSTFIQGLFLLPFGLNVKNCNDISKGLYLSVLFVAMLNVVMPILLMFQSIADFYSNFTWNYDGETLYRLHKGEKYEGGILVFLCISVTICFIFKWMLYVTNSNKIVELCRFIFKMRIAILLGTTTIVAIFIPYMYIGFSSYTEYDKESRKLDDKINAEISRVQKLGSDRRAKDVKLSFMGIQLGTSIRDGKSIALNDNNIYAIGGIVFGKIGTNGFGGAQEDSLCFSDCSYFKFATELNGNEVEVYVNAYQDVIYSISIHHKGWINDEELEKIYRNKYGEPTRDTLFIKQEMDTRSYNYYVEHLKYNNYKKTGYSDLENEYQTVDEDLYWIFKNHSITMSESGLYVIYMYDSLQKKAELYKNSIISKEQERVRLREIEQARKDSLEKVTQERIKRESEKAAKIKQLNDI